MAKDDFDDFDDPFGAGGPDPFAPDGGDFGGAFDDAGGNGDYDGEQDFIDEGDEEFNEEAPGKEPPSKLMLAGIAGGIVVAVLVVLGIAISLFNSSEGDGAQYTQEDVDNAYQLGSDDASKEYLETLGEKDREIDNLSSQVREARDEANAARKKADGSSDQSTETLREAQRIIDEVSRDRDNYKRMYEDQIAETERAHDRIRTLEYELGR